jgi:hypothetical protein
MLHRMGRRLRGDSRGPWILASALLLAVVVSPFAIAQGSLNGTPLKGGARNPSENPARDLTKETEIIADTSTYGTRQSNKSDNGGGAIYGCRSGQGGSPRNNEPCIRANNLSSGLAFEFATSGEVAGRITAQGAGAKPFTTNATGVADGLNADRVDGKDAAQIVADAQAQNRIAAVAADGTLGLKRGAQSAERTAAGRYTVTFDSDVNACAYGATSTDLDTATIVSAAAGTTARTVRVATFGQDGTPRDAAFHLVATC